MTTLYPITGFRFKVLFSGLDEEVDMSFQEVSGLEMTVETDKMREGGEYAFTYQLPTRISHPELVLKRGLPTKSKLSEWVRKAMEDFNFKPLLVTITLLNEQNKPRITWQAYQAWPLGWTLSGFNAANGEIVVETLKLAYAHLRILAK